jgi:hypothetical protein
VAEIRNAKDGDKVDLERQKEKETKGNERDKKENRPLLAERPAEPFFTGTEVPDGWMRSLSSRPKPV